MEKESKFLNYLRLIRIQGSVFTAIIIIGGSLILMSQIDFLHLLILFIIGILIHIFLFVLNEYIDIKVDEKSQYLQDKPLVSGSISKSNALFLSLSACIFVYTLTILFFFSVLSLILISLAIFIGAVYDLLGKKIPGADFFVAGTGFFACLFGSSTVSLQFTNLVYIIALVIFFYLVFNNAVAGGLKDVDHDFKAGAKTTVTRLGVKVKKGKLFFTNKFSAFVYSNKLVYFGLIVLAGFQTELSLWQSDQFIIDIIIIFLIIVIFMGIYRLLLFSTFDREFIIKVLGITEMATYSLVPIILYPLIGFNMTLFLLIVPIGWFIIFNMILYGKPMQPDV
jgi:4-hydroxybenzoate polyprenyltransferase